MFIKDWCRKQAHIFYQLWNDGVKSMTIRRFQYLDVDSRLEMKYELKTKFKTKFYIEIRCLNR